MNKAWTWLVIIALSQSGLAQNSAAAKYATPYADARALFENLRKEALPPDLTGMPPADVERAWPAWISRRDAEIRARVEQGEEDSIINLLLFGTSFTAERRASERELAAVAADPTRAPTTFARRLDDLVAGISAPRANARLAFARSVAARKGIDPETAAGAEQLRRYLRDNLVRVAREVAIYDRAIESAAHASDPSVHFLERSTLFRNRGLSSDTSLFTDHAIDQALRMIQRAGTLLPGTVERVGIIGPGLDFTDKHEGFDFYPQQTIQPFAVIDSLIRLGFAREQNLRIVTFDISARINQHLTTARQHASEGDGYVVQLPRDSNVSWHPDLERYWTNFGDQIGKAVPAIAAPPNAGGVRSRAVRVRPAVVAAVVPQDLNIVTERLNLRTSNMQFDIIVATNIFVYYDTFQQSLALLNAASMLRPGGILVVNGRVFLLAPIPLEPAGQIDVIYTYHLETGEVGDRISWFQRPK
jgi:hypothetical protein